jgi:hypothetical protein
MQVCIQKKAENLKKEQMQLQQTIHETNKKNESEFLSEWTRIFATHQAPPKQKKVHTWHHAN